MALTSSFCSSVVTPHLSNHFDGAEHLMRRKHSVDTGITNRPELNGRTVVSRDNIRTIFSLHVKGKYPPHSILVGSYHLIILSRPGRFRKISGGQHRPIKWLVWVVQDPKREGGHGCKEANPAESSYPTISSKLPRSAAKPEWVLAPKFVRTPHDG